MAPSDAMNRQQAFDPVDVLDSFADQSATLTMQPTVVLFGDTRLLRSLMAYLRGEPKVGALCACRSTSTLSVLAWRARRSTCTLAGSMT
jgi:hypothetical protein